MPIAFQQINLASRLPGYQVEFDNSQAITGLVTDLSRAVMFGQKLSTGTAPVGVPTRVLSPDHGVALAGRGSMAAEMCRLYKKNNGKIDLYLVALEDNPEGQVASASVTIAGPATSASTRALYVGYSPALAYTRIDFAVAAGATAAQVATSLVTAINSRPDLVFTAAVDGTDPAKVNLTARHKGEAMNGLDMRLSYYVTDQVNDGLTLTLAPFAGGSGNPDLADALAGLGDMHFHSAIMPYCDGANLAKIRAEFEARNHATRQKEGQVYACYRGANHAALTTLSATQNSEILTPIHNYGVPTASYNVAAIAGAVAAYQADIDPARPLQTLELVGMAAPAIADRFDDDERNLLLYDGISTFKVTDDGRCIIERMITSYQVNAFGLPDESYLDTETVATLFVLRRTLRARWAQKFPRHKLADDGTNFGPGQAIVTPSVLRAETIALARDWEYRGWVENLEDFKAKLIVERNADDRSRADSLIPPDLVNGFRRFAGLVQFRL